MLEQMSIKDKEYSKHMTTIKKAWIKWGKNQAIKGQRITTNNERFTYGSKFDQLGVSRG